MKRLDRAFARVDWIHSYPYYCLRNQPILHSDHGPIIVDFEHQLLFRHRPFHFKHMWLLTPLARKLSNELGIHTLLVLELFNLRLKPLGLDLPSCIGIMRFLARLKNKS